MPGTALLPRRHRCWRTSVLVSVVPALLATACTTRGQADTDMTGRPPDVAAQVATPEQEVVEAFAAHVGAADGPGPPAHVRELDVAAGQAIVEDCTVTDAGVTGVTAVMRRTDGQWDATRVEDTGPCVPPGLLDAVDRWWEVRRDWLEHPNPSDARLSELLTGPALDDTRAVLTDWADRGWRGHVGKVTTGPWAVALGPGTARVESCGWGTNMIVGSVGIFDTVSEEWVERLVHLDGDSDQVVLEFVWTDGRWLVEHTTVPGIAPGSRSACEALCDGDDVDWCLVDPAAITVGLAGRP